MENGKPEQLNTLGFIAVEEATAFMPLRSNVPEPGAGDWELTRCPKCGRECWYQAENAKKLKTAWPHVKVKFRCTECALKEGTA